MLPSSNLDRRGETIWCFNALMRTVVTDCQVVVMAWRWVPSPNLSNLIPFSLIVLPLMCRMPDAWTIGAVWLSLRTTHSMPPVSLNAGVNTPMPIQKILPSRVHKIAPFCYPVARFIHQSTKTEVRGSDHV
jgi:hypothetical protein